MTTGDSTFVLLELCGENQSESTVSQIRNGVTGQVGYAVAHHTSDRKHPNVGVLPIIQLH